MSKSKWNGKWWFCGRCRKQTNGKEACTNCGNKVKPQ